MGSPHDLFNIVKRSSEISIKSVIKNGKKADAANFGAALIRFGRRVIGRAWMGAEIAEVTLTV
jgi:hypothetical protein